LCPFSSRLVVERWERVMTVDEREEKQEEEEKKEGKGSRSSKREEGGEDRIVLRYNGLVVKTLNGGLAKWKEVYAEVLAVRCVLDWMRKRGWVSLMLSFFFLSFHLILSCPLTDARLILPIPRSLQARRRVPCPSLLLALPYIYGGRRLVSQSPPPSRTRAGQRPLSKRGSE